MAICACSFEPENHQQALDVANDQESHSPSMEAIQVGEALLAISQGLRDTAQISEQAGYENEEYFFGKLWKKTKEVLKGVGKAVGSTAKEVGKVVGKTAKGVITSKAADITKKFLKKKLGGSGQEDKTDEEQH